MKASNFLRDVGRPVAYYPGLKVVTGSTTATILFCQFLYWADKGGEDGWIYKTAEEIEGETGLSYEEQKTARAKLKERGLLEEHYDRLAHRMYYRLNIEALNRAWDEKMTGNDGSHEPPNKGSTRSRTREVLAPEQGNPTFGKAGIPCSLNKEYIDYNIEYSIESGEQKLGANAPAQVSLDETDTLGDAAGFATAGNVEQVKKDGRRKAKKNSPPENKEVSQKQPSPGFPADIASYASVFAELFGREPYKDEKSLWIRVFRKWDSAGARLDDVRKAYKQAEADGLTIKSPASIDFAVDKIVRERKKKAAPQQEGESKKEIIEIDGARYMLVGGVRVRI